jgi:hypothetical protein
MRQTEFPTKDDPVMDDRQPVDTAQPWTIKSVPTATRDAVTRAARKEGLTVGQWLEKRVAEWEADGGPVPVQAGPPVNLGELAQAMQAAREFAKEAGVPVPPQLAKDSLNLIRRTIRQTRPAQPSKRRTTPQQAIASEQG